MSWWNSNFSDFSWSDHEDGNLYQYSQVPAINGNIYPLDYHPFRQLSEAAVGYMETQSEVPLYDSTHFEFMELASCIDAIHYEREPKLHRFRELPAELRLEIYTHYLTAECKSGGPDTHRHIDRHGNSCCVWNWPNQLAICDHAFVPGISWFAPCLPSLAFANKQVRDELVIHMLQTTEWFDFLYVQHKPIKIAACFANFLARFPNDEGFKAIKRINFPRMHHYNETRIGRVIDDWNPDIELMLRCPKLETMAMTFKWPALLSQESQLFWQNIPRDLQNFLDHFQLRAILEHPSLKQVHLEGVYGLDKKEDLLCLEQFAKWIVTGFKEGQGRIVDVYLHRRRHHWTGRTVGERIVID